MKPKTSDAGGTGKDGGDEKKVRELVPPHVARRVQEVALASLPISRRRTSNLYLENRVLRRGETIGPKFDPVRIEQDSVLCFADHQPNANYSHECQFLLFDAVSGRPLRRIRSKFPPYEIEGRGSLRAFHEPVPTAPRLLPTGTGGPAPCPSLPPVGRRFAILFAGAAQRHHVNDLELCYRTLTSTFHFDPNDVFILAHSGVATDRSGPFVGDDRKPRKWVDGSDFTMTLRPMRPGTAEELEDVFTALTGAMKADDLLFIHTNGHGGFDVFPESDPRLEKGSYLCTWAADNPVGGKYFANTMQLRLNALPNHRMLLMLAQQCYGGGFKDPVLNGSKAQESSIACAAEASGVSYWSADKNFTHFTLDWLSAQRRQRPEGTGVNVDGNISGAIEACESYGYAYTNRDTRDSPNCASKPAAADLTIALSEANPLSPSWCALVTPLLGQYRKKNPGPPYDRILRSVLPELREAVLPVLKRQAGEVRLELTARLTRILSEAFGEAPPGPGSEEEKKVS